jgi:hypothetical protein
LTASRDGLACAEQAFGRFGNAWADRSHGIFHGAGFWLRVGPWGVKLEVRRIVPLTVVREGWINRGLSFNFSVFTPMKRGV